MGGGGGWGGGEQSSNAVTELACSAVPGLFQQSEALKHN